MLMDRYYKRSDDAVLADKLMRFGQILAVWLTNKDDITTFHLMYYKEDGLYVDGLKQKSVRLQFDFFLLAAEQQAEFLLPISDPTILLQQEITLLKIQIEGFKAALEMGSKNG